MHPDNESIEEWERRRKLLMHPPGIINAASLLRASKDDPEFLIPDRIPAGGITLVVAPPGSTKSWLVYDLALKVAQGGRYWLDTETPAEAAPVLVLSYDNPTQETARRFKRLGLKATDPIYFHSVDRDAWKMPKHADILSDLCHEIAPRLVVVDSFRQAVDGNENDSEEMGAVMGGYKTMAATPSHPAVIVVHHAGKGINMGGAGTRGSGEIEGSADAIIAIEDGAVRWTKARSWAISEDLRLHYTLKDEGHTTQLVCRERKRTNVV